jgi:hypothetical protein
LNVYQTLCEKFAWQLGGGPSLVLVAVLLFP